MSQENMRQKALAERDARIFCAVHGVPHASAQPEYAEIENNFITHLNQMKEFYGRIPELTSDALPNVPYKYQIWRLLIDLVVTFGSWYAMTHLGRTVELWLLLPRIIMISLLIAHHTNFSGTSEEGSYGAKYFVMVPVYIAILMLHELDKLHYFKSTLYISIFLGVICLLRYAIYVFKMKDLKDATKKMEKLSNELGNSEIEERKTLYALLPGVRKMLLAYQEEWYSMYSGWIGESELYSEEEILPEKFWWEVKMDTVWDTYEKEEISGLGENRFLSNMKVDFQTYSENEYAPLHKNQGKDFSLTQREIAGKDAFSVDVLLEHVYKTYSTSTSTREVYANSDSDRAAVKAAVWMDASSIDDDYNSGRIDRAEHLQRSTQLMNEVENFVNPYLNETKTETVTYATEHTESHTESIGHFSLRPDENREGQYYLCDVSGKSEYLYSVVRMIRSYPISVILYDERASDSTLVARLYSMYPNAI